MNTAILVLIVLVSLFLLLLALLLAWAWLPLNPDRLCELDPTQYGADDAHPVLKEFPHD